MTAKGKDIFKDRIRPRSVDMVNRPPKRRHLPSLGSFATFEVAAKHLSFTLAASELHVTQAAISQHIRGLEKSLNCQLFLRKHNSMELTAEGRLLLQAVTHGLDRLSDAIAQVGQGGDERTITLSGTYAGMSNFVKPLVDAYRADHPHIQFTLLASDENDHLQDFEEVDIAIVCGNERSEIGDHLTPLFSEIVDPVCSPDYLAAHGPFDGPKDLLRADIMELHRFHWSSEAIGWYPLRWSDWFHHHAGEIDAPVPAFMTNSYGMLVQSAIAGQGVILGWRHHVYKPLEDGQLVRIFDLPLNSGRNYYLKLKPRARQKPHITAFVDYLKAAIDAIPMLHD
ncbi:LysR substrate-binding domain-containing protein [Falsirhodobacter xinxiangensis]|uniref:LysR substrate-binding domain-containing protein n=1 Tax=Falsirhodobacter xinxiangensis TaxID=2530049 RepID=UPI001C706ED6|nr:LysR substrate-binding domain-containing protein [Rhodobacter xinxiangensis]